MFLSKVLHKPHLVGVIMIVLLFGAGFIYAFAFDGFNIEKVTGSEVEAWLASTSDSGSGGGDDDDTPPESPTPENPEGEGDPPEGEGDPPGDEVHPVPEGDPPDCDCDSSGDKNVKRCDCGGQEWNADVEIWTNPCKSKIKVYPCPGRNGEGCTYRHAHTGKRMKRKEKEWHCPCENHAINGSRGTWKICKDSNSTACKGKCKNGNRK